MKIFQSNLFQNPIIEKKQVIPYRNYGIQQIQQDTFIKTTPISFKAGENIYAQILKSPQKTEQYIKLMERVVAGLIAAAGIEAVTANENTSDNGGFLGNILGMFGQNKNNAQEIELNKYKEENEKLRQENETLKEKLNANSAEEVEQKETTLLSSKLNISFPKKRGRLTQNQQNLKLTVEQMEFSDETAEKMLAICSELLTKKFHKIDNQMKTNDEIIKSFNEELQLSKDSDCKTKYIINKYLYICELFPKEEKDHSIESDSSFISLPKLEGTRVLGKIDLPETKKSEKISDIIVRDTNGNIISVYFKKSGTPSEYSATQLDEILRYFVKTIYNDYKDKEKQNPGLEKPKWLYNIPLPKSIRKLDITKELKEGRYERIKDKHIQEIVEVINEDPRYSDLFDIHSALRLIDRYVKFNSVDTGIDVQSKKILDKLFEMIEQGYKDGIYVDVYVDKKSGFTGPSITLKAENFDEEALELFGSADIVLGISERQKGKVYRGVDNNKKEAIISTIYPEGM